MLRQLVLITLAALGLASSFVCDDLFLLPWICFVPFLFALEGISLKRAYFLGLVLGCLFFTIASYWIVGFLKNISDINLGYAIFLASTYWIYCAQQHALLAVVLVWFAKRKIGAEWLGLSLFSTLFFYSIPLIFPADLSVTQSKFLLALQGVDITGALGLHFVILLHNGLLYTAIKKLFQPLNRIQQTALAIIFCWFVYGISAYYYWSAQEKKWPTLNVGVVQPNIAASINIPAPVRGYSRAYATEIDLSVSLARAGASLIVWPEARYRGFFNEDYIRDAFKYYAGTTNASFLIQDLQTKDRLTFNTSALVNESGWQEHSKYLRIPFGEYLPLEDIPIVGSFVKNIFGDFYTPIAEGAVSDPMEFRKIKIQPLICFEAANAYYLANVMQLAFTHKKAIQLLTVQSNDSWFNTNIEPRLHLATSHLRSVEQRIPLVHALNNGPSSFYKANGQVSARLASNERSAGVVNMAYPQESKLTLFARFPHAFILIVLVSSIWLLSSLGWSERRKNL
jgi:apolipoprotein N-acyltransferase